MPLKTLKQNYLYIVKVHTRVKSFFLCNIQKDQNNCLQNDTVRIHSLRVLQMERLYIISKFDVEN